MNRSPTRRGLIALVAVLLGGSGVFAIVRHVQAAEKRAMAGQDLVEVFVVIDPIEAGTPAAAIGRSIEAQQVPVAFRAEDAVTSVEALGDLATSAELVPGEQLLTSRFAPPQARTVAGGATAVPDGFLELTIETSPERGVGAQVRPGEFVAVVATFDGFGDGGTANQVGVGAGEGTEAAGGVTGRPPDRGSPRTHFLLRKALVTNVQAQGQAPQVEEEADRSRTPPAGTLLVTLAVEPSQVERLVFAGEFGTLWLARDAALAPEESTPIVSHDNIFTGDLLSDPGPGSPGAPPAEVSASGAPAGPGDPTEAEIGSDPSTGGVGEGTAEDPGTGGGGPDGGAGREQAPPETLADTDGQEG